MKSTTAKKSVLYLLFLIVGIPLIIFLVLLGKIYTFGNHDFIQKAKIEVVLGAAEFNGTPSNVLKARLDHAALLYRQGFATTIITTGGSQNGDLYTEAGVGRTYLISLGIPPANIIADATGNDTYQTMVAVSKTLKSFGATNAIFVSDPFHEYRVYLIASQLGISDISSPTRTSPIRGMSSITYYLREAVAIEMAKLVGFKFLSVLRHGS